MQFVLKKYQLFGVSYLLRPLEQMTPVLWMFLATLCPIHNCVASVNPLSQSPIMCQFWHHPEYPDHHPVYHPVHHHCSSLFIIQFCPSPQSCPSPDIILFGLLSNHSNPTLIFLGWVCACVMYLGNMYFVFLDVLFVLGVCISFRPPLRSSL